MNIANIDLIIKINIRNISTLLDRRVYSNFYSIRNIRPKKRRSFEDQFHSKFQKINSETGYKIIQRFLTKKKK